MPSRRRRRMPQGELHRCRQRGSAPRRLNSPVRSCARRRNEKSRFSAGEETGCAAPMFGPEPIPPNPSREGCPFGSEQGRSPGSRRLRSPSRPRRVAALRQWHSERATREADHCSRPLTVAGPRRSHTGLPVGPVRLCQWEEDSEGRWRGAKGGHARLGDQRWIHLVLPSVCSARTAVGRLPSDAGVPSLTTCRACRLLSNQQVSDGLLHKSVLS